MVHTRFFAIEIDAVAQFEAMKAALSEILAIIPSDDELEAKSGRVSAALDLFIQWYP